MIQECVFIVFFLQITLHPLKTNEIPIFNHLHVGHMKPRSLVTRTAITNFYDTLNSITKKIIGEKLLPHYDLRHHIRIPELHTNNKPHLTESQPVYRKLYKPSSTGIMSVRSLPDWHGSLPAKPYAMNRPGFINHLPRPDVPHNMNAAWNTPLHPHTNSELNSPAQSTQVNNSSIVPHNRLKPLVTMTTAGVRQQFLKHNNLTSVNVFTQSLDDFERRFYKVSFCTYYDIPSRNLSIKVNT